MERIRPLVVGDLVSVAAYHFDNVPSSGKQHVEARWSHQTFGAAWRTARCSGKLTKDLGKGNWQVAWTDPGWEGKRDVVKTTALRIETDGARTGKQLAASPPKQEEEEPQPDSRAAAAARRTAARDAAPHPQRKGSTEPNDQETEAEPEEEMWTTDGDGPPADGAAGAHEDPTQHESDRKRRRVDVSPSAAPTPPPADSSEPMQVEPAPQTSASSEAPTAETEAPDAEAAGAPSDAPAAISTPDDAPDGNVALVAEASTEQLVAAGVAGAPRGPLAEAMRCGRSQCARHPFCWRGFQHEGKGGHCAMDTAAMAAAAAAYPASSFAKSPLKSPSVHARPPRPPKPPPKLLVSVPSREPEDPGSTPQGTPRETPTPRPRSGQELGGGCELYSSKLLTDIPAWMLDEELQAGELDKKLWDGAAEAGWRMLPKYRGGGAKNNWLYRAPSGAQLKNRASSLVAKADGGAAAAAAAAAAQAGQFEPRRLSSGRIGAGLERASARAALTSPDRPSGCLRKRGKSDAATTTTQDMSTEFGAALVGPASERLRSALWQPTPLPFALSPSEAAQRMTAAASRGTSRAGAPPPILGGAGTGAGSSAAAAAPAAAAPKLGGVRYVLEQLATVGASERARQQARQMLADSGVPMAVVGGATAPAATAAVAASSASPAPEAEVTVEDDGAASAEPMPVEEAASEDALGRGSRARRLPKWRAAEAARDEAEGDKTLKTPPASEVDAAADAQQIDADGSEDDDDDDDEADAARVGSFAGGSACWGIYYLPSGRDGIDRFDAEQGEQIEAPAAAPAASADGGEGGTGEGGAAKKWVAPLLGAFVAVPGGDGAWVKGEVVHVAARRGHATLTVREDGPYSKVHSCTQRDEGKTWRRIGPAVDALVEVEVEEEGEISWRLARVRQRYKNGDFTAVVLFPDGSPDEDFVEKFPLSAEGVDWRHTAQSNGTGFEPSAMSSGGGGGGGGGGGESSVDAAAAKAAKDSKKGKRFGREVTEALEAAFSRALRGATPSGEALAELRQLTGLEVMQVQGWFANRRLRLKKELQQQQQQQPQPQQQDEEEADRREEEEAILAAQAKAKAAKATAAVVEL